MNTPTPTPTPRTDAATYPADCLGKTLVTNRDCSRALETELVTLTAERDQLRAVFPQICAAIGNGAFCTPTVSIGFIESIPNEVQLVVAELRARAERAEAAETVALAKWNGTLERALKAEADLAALEQCHDDNCRAVVKFAADLAAERARLDWLEDSSRCLHVCIDRQPDGYSIHNMTPSTGSVRSAIDAAMKEGAK
jgi:hypothetical protein